MFKKIASVAMLLLAVVVFAAFPVQAGEPAQVERQAFDQVMTNPCTGEDVHVTGILQIVERWAHDEGGGGHYSFHIAPQNMVGEGLSTGATYRFSGSIAEVANIPWTADGRAEEFTIIDQHHFIAKGVSENTVMQETIHVTINANGDWIVDKWELLLKCR